MPADKYMVDRQRKTRTVKLPFDRTHEERVRDAMGGRLLWVVAVSSTVARNTGETEEAATVWSRGRDGEKTATDIHIRARLQLQMQNGVKDRRLEK